MKFDGHLAADSVSLGNLITFILSNDFDYLIAQLKRQLYGKSNILTRKLLVVPGDEPFRVFEAKCLKDEQIGLNFGYRSVNLNLAVEVLARTVFPEIRFPKKKALRQVLIEKLSNIEKGTNEELEELKNYLDNLDPSLGFYHLLASNFISYGQLGMQEDIPKRLQFQKILYEELKAEFDWPKEVLTQPIPQVELAAGIEVHLLGFSMIPPLYLQFFKKLAKVVPLFFYVPSVSRALSLDFVSDVVQGIDLDPLEKNPLIANFQTGLKPNLKFLVDESSFQMEEFAFKNSIEAGDFSEKVSLKEAFISSLVEARVLKDLEKTQVALKDDLLLFKAPNPYREVEEMVEWIKKLIMKEQIALEEIVIVCPNLQAYAPLLSYHFERNNLPYQIQLPLYYGSLEDEDACTLISLLKSRWTKQDVLRFLSCKSILKKLSISENEQKTLKKVIEDSSITFGFDAEHRLEVLKSCSPEDLSIGTIEHFFDQIYLSNVYSSNQMENLIFGKADFDLDQRLFACFAQVHESLLLIHQLKTVFDRHKLSLKEYIQQTFLLFERLFDKEFLFDLRSRFQDELEAAKGKSYSAEIFYDQLLEKIEDKKTGLAAKGKTKIACVEFSEGVYFGKKCVFVLGAQDSSFPNIIEKNSLDLSKQENGITNLQMQKGMFLHLIGLNSAYLYFSYSEVGFDQKEQILSLFVEKMLQYLDLYFENENGLPISLQIIRKIPEYPFSKERFFQPTFDERGYALLKKLEAPKKHPIKVEIHQDAEKPSIVIDLKDLELLLKNPVRFFVRKALKFHLPFEEGKKEFELPSFKKRQFIENVLGKEEELFFEQLKFRGKLPQYRFLSLFEDSLKNDFKTLSGLYSRIKSFSDDPRKLQMKKNTEIFFKSSDQKWVLPAIKMDFDCGKLVEIVGSIQEFRKGFLLIPQEIKQENLFSFWPRILLYSHCSKVLQEESYQLIGLDGKQKEISIDKPIEKLQALLKYQEKASKSISFYYDSLVKKVVKGKEEADIYQILLQKQETDPYFQFFNLDDCQMEEFIDSLASVYNSFEDWFKG